MDKKVSRGLLTRVQLESLEELESVGTELSITAKDVRYLYISRLRTDHLLRMVIHKVSYIWGTTYVS